MSEQYDFVLPFFKESIQVESPGGEDSSSNIDESLGTDGDVDEDKGEVTKTEISEKQCSPSERKHASIDVDNDDDDDDHGPEERDEEEDNGDEDEDEIEMNNQKREMDETLKHGGTLAEKLNIGNANVLHDECRTKQQEGHAAAVQQQKKPKVFHLLFDLAKHSIYLTLLARNHMDLHFCIMIFRIFAVGKCT